MLLATRPPREPRYITPGNTESWWNRYFFTCLLEFASVTSSRAKNYFLMDLVITKEDNDVSSLVAAASLNR